MAATGSPVTLKAYSTSLRPKAAKTNAIAPTHQSIAAPGKPTVPLSPAGDLPADPQQQHKDEQEEAAQQKPDEAQSRAAPMIKRVGGETSAAMPVMVGEITGGKE